MEASGELAMTWAPRGSSDLRDQLDREGRLPERSDRQPQQEQRLVIGSRSIEVHLVAAEAPVDQHPLAVTANGDGDRLHRRPAVGVPISGGVVVEVLAPQAAGAVVSVRGPGCSEWDVETAVTAAERAGAVVARVSAWTIAQVGPP